MKYIVLDGIPGSVPNCNTVEDLKYYLADNAENKARLISCQFVNGNFIIIWELE